MSRVLVTGGAGFIGSHLVKELVAGKNDVAIYVRESTSLERLDEVRDEIKVFRGDVEDVDEVIAAVGAWGAEVVAHLAWYAEPRTYLESPQNLANLASSLALLPRLEGAGCRRLIVTGTCAEYAQSRERLREDSPVDPQTLYAACKLAMQMVSSKMASQSGLQVTWARIFHLYGPWEHEHRLVPSVIRTLLRGEEFRATAGHQVRDYLHVADVASALRALIEKDVVGTVNVCSGRKVTVREVIETIAALLHRENSIRLGAIASRGWDPPYICGHNARLVNEAGWAPRHELRSGLAETIDWWRER